MRTAHLSKLFLLVISAVAISSCQQVEPNTATASTSPSTTENHGKIPVTTSSEEARKEFLTGRDLFEKLRITDSIAHCDKAISLDPNFALAELLRANVSPSPNEFFDHLRKAVALADKVSNGERLLIIATEEGANGDLAKQKETLEKLVAAYPNDERAHFNLGGYYFGQQDFTQAISHYERATKLAPDYSTAFNILGYAYRQNEAYSDAENAFKKYIELIPNDPNPYDSYAELLLKMGRFDEAITQYSKALAIDSNFINSHFGIAAALTYKGKPGEARAELQKMTQKARTDGERRTALFGQAIVAVDSGNLNQALAEVENEYAIAQKNNDATSMNGDLQLKANILLEMGKYDAAQQAFEQALKRIMDSGLSQQVKDNTERFNHYNFARVAVARQDLAKAKAETEAFRKGVQLADNANQLKQVHELAGRIALAEKNYETAIAELGQANQQNPDVLYLMAQAYKAKGDAQKAKTYYTKAAKFNSLPQLNYSLVRIKAEKALAS